MIGRNFHLVILLVLGLFASGCSSAKVPVSDMAKARELADKILVAWKSGALMEDLKSQTPPIIVSEDLWRNKLILIAYEIVGDAEMMGSNVRLKVRLNYIDKSGKKVEQSLRYLVTTTPAITFFREEV